MDTVAFIPVRGGSRSIPRKNIRLIAGRPLVHWATAAALGCPEIGRVYVASDDPEIRVVAGQLACPRLRVVDRDPETATDEATTESALLDFAEAYDFDRVVLIQATSPLLTAGDLSGALARMDTLCATSLVSVTREHRFRWSEHPGGLVTPMNYDPRDRPRRQDWSGELQESGAFYITARAALLESRCRISGWIAAWEMPRKTAIELDDPDDWVAVSHHLSL